MTEPLDVSLRVKLDYQAGGPAKAAVADVEAIRKAAQQLGTPAAGNLAKELGSIAAQAKEAERVIANIRDAAKRSAAEGSVADAARKSATAAVGAYEREFGKLDAAKTAARMFGAVKAEAEQVRRGLGEVGRASEALAATSGPRAMQRELGAVREAAAKTASELHKVRLEAGKLGTAPPLHAGGGANGGGGGIGSGQAGPAAAGGGHGGGRQGFLRTLERGAAMPFHVERAAALFGTAGGALGLGGGLALYQAQRMLHDATDQAIAFEAAMVDLRRVTGQVSQDGFKVLETGILKTSRTTGVATGELAKFAAEAVAAGRPVADLPRLLDFSAKAAGAFGENIGDAGSRLGQVASAFKLNQSGLEDAGNVAAFIAQRNGTSGAGTLDFMARMSGFGSMIGLSPDKLAAVGATAQKLGIGPDQAATTVQDVIEKLENAPTAGEGFIKGLHRMTAPDGLPESAYAMRNTARADPSAAFMRLLDGVKSIDPERRTTVLTELFGPEQAELVARMSDHVEDFRKNFALLRDQAGRSGAVEKAFRIFDDTTRGKLETMTAALGNFAMRVGQAFAPGVGVVADAITKSLNALNDASDRAEKAQAAVDQLRTGKPMSPEMQAEADRDPKLKADIQRQLDRDEYNAARDRSNRPARLARLASRRSRAGIAWCPMRRTRRPRLHERRTGATASIASKSFKSCNGKGSAALSSAPSCCRRSGVTGPSSLTRRTARKAGARSSVASTARCPVKRLRSSPAFSTNRPTARANSPTLPPRRRFRASSRPGPRPA